MKKLILSGAAAIIAIAVIIIIAINIDKMQQMGCMRAFLYTYYSNENNEIRPPSSNPQDEKKFFENIDSLYKTLYQEKYSGLLTDKAFETLCASRYLFYPQTIQKTFNCSLKLKNVKFKQLSDAFGGNPAFSFEANINVFFSDNTSRHFAETGSFVLKKQKNKWLIDTFSSRRELYSIIE